MKATKTKARPFRIGLGLLVLAAVAAPPAKAAMIVAGQTTFQSTAIMDLTLLPDTPFNSTATAITLDGVSGSSDLTLNRDAQSGSTINISSFGGGMFQGYDPNLGGKFVFGNVGTLTGSDFSGSITNVVQNAADPGFASGAASSFQSGDFSFGGDSFGFTFLGGPAAGLTLYTDPSVPFQFSATFDGLPPSVGTVLKNSGTDVLDIYYNGQVVAESSDRTIVLTAAVPEPASLVMLGIGVVGTLAYARRRARPARVA